MMTTFYRNQYTDGGAVTAEKWQLFDASNISIKIGSCYSLEQKEVELPEGFTVEESACGDMVIYDNGVPCGLVYNEKSDTMTAVSINGMTTLW